MQFPATSWFYLLPDSDVFCGLLLFFLTLLLLLLMLFKTSPIGLHAKALAQRGSARSSSRDGCGEAASPCPSKTGCAEVGGTGDDVLASPEHAPCPRDADLPRGGLHSRRDFAKSRNPAALLRGGRLSSACRGGEERRQSCAALARGARPAPQCYSGTLRGMRSSGTPLSSPR